MRKRVLSGLGVLLFTGLAAAQLHPNGYACGTINFGKKASEPTVWILDGSGTVVASIGSGADSVYGLVMDNQNELLIVTNADGKIYRIDPRAGVNLGTLADFGSVGLRDVAVGQNGTYFVSDSFPSDAIYEVDPRGRITTITTLRDDPQGGMDIDIDTSHLLVQSTLGADPLRLVSRDGTTVSILGTGFDARHGGVQHLLTGDWYSGSCCGDSTSAPQSLYVLWTGAPAPAVFAAFAEPAGVYSLKADRASASVQRLICGAAYFPGQPGRGQGLYALDLATKRVTKLSAVTASSIYEVEILYRRNLSSRRTGRGRWDINIRIPEDANRPFVLAASASGVRPGLIFPIGRTLPLNLDAITYTGVLTGWAPFLYPTRGLLDGQGRALVKMDVSIFPPTANGTRLWFVCVTLDSSAPGSVKTITDPHVIQIEGL